MLAITGLFMSVQTLRAEDVLDPPASDSSVTDVQNFSRITCMGHRDGQIVDLAHGYFLNVDTLRQAQALYPARFEFLAKRCEGDAQWVVESVLVSGREPRNWNAPCTEDAQCESGSCHLQFGKCDPRFPIPFNVAH